MSHAYSSRTGATHPSLGEALAHQHADTVEFFRLGYSGRADTLDFTVTIRQWPTFTAIMMLPELLGLKIVQEFEPLWDQVSTVELGREASLVMYVHIPYTQQQRNGGDNSRSIPITHTDRVDLTQRVLDAGARAGADERTVLQHRTTGVYLAEAIGRPGPCPKRVRLWWD